VVGTAAQVFLAAAAAAAAPDGSVTPPKDRCEPKVSAAVAELYPVAGPKLKVKVEQLTADLAVATARVELLTAQAAHDPKIKQALVDALAVQAAKKDLLTKGKEDLQANLKLTTATQIVSWPNHGLDFRRDDSLDIDDVVLAKWIVDPTDRKNSKPQFAVFLALLTLDSNQSKWMAPTPTPTINVKVGVPVRLAQTTKLLMCAAAKCPIEASTVAPFSDTITAGDFSVLQAGLVYLVPTTGGHFKSESAAITLDAGGTPSSIKSEEKVAAASALTGAAKEAATQLAALPASIRASELAKTEAETKQINANAALTAAKASAGLTGQTTVLTAQTALINAQATFDAAQAGLKQQTDSLTAQTALLNAQATLATAQANAPNTNQISAFGAQAALLNAQTALLNAAAALAKAQASMP
jgi:hypothetical protein